MRKENAAQHTGVGAQLSWEPKSSEGIDEQPASRLSGRGLDLWADQDLAM